MKDAATRRDGAGIDIDFLAGQQSSSTVGTVGHHVSSMEIDAHYRQRRF